MNRNRAFQVFLLVILVLSAGLAVYFLQRSKPVPLQVRPVLPAGCADVSFESAAFIVCKIDVSTHRIELRLSDETGKPWRSLDRFATAMRGEGRPILFAMNAGMYHEDLSPVGLFVANQQRIAPLQTGSGEGNFFMQPNGVFGIYADGWPFVTSTDAYLVSPRVVEFATQSGPMLVIDGTIHPRFEPDGNSRNVRNGVGIDQDGRAVFAISREPVSFGKFARLFRDQLNCRNALYLDGVVSALYGSDSIVQGGGYPAGPIVAVFQEPEHPQ